MKTMESVTEKFVLANKVLAEISGIVDFSNSEDTSPKIKEALGRYSSRIASVYRREAEYKPF